MFKLSPSNYSPGLRFNHYRFFSTFLLLLVSINYLACQRNISPQANKAIEYFNNKQFNPAVIEFRNLLVRYPKDALYEYYLGASLTEMNIAPAEAIENLKEAISNGNAYLSWYYLYKIYFRQFRFAEAKTALEEFKKMASRHEKKFFEISKEEEQIANATLFFNSAIKVNVFDIKKTSFDSVFIWLACATKLKSELVPTNNSKDSIKIFVQQSIKLDDYRYFAANSNLGLKRKDIFRIKKLGDNKWTKPENLGKIINTEEDEDFPYFDFNSGTLFFASQGHGSAGGFDIFKSNYDSLKKEWSKPQQLPFPINSPMNDFLYISDSSGAYFVSDRECIFGNIKIYNIELPLQNLESIDLKPEEKQIESFLKIPQRTVNINNFEIKKQNTPQNKVNADTNLLEIISKALEIQMISDSAKLFAKRFKVKLIDEDDKDKRAIIFSEISKFEKKSAKYQRSANDLYVKVNEIQFKKPSNTIRFKNGTNLHDTSIFSIEAASPYSEENPFATEIELPDGIIYRIQLGVYNKPVEYDYFGGIQPISIELIQNNKITKYYAGIFKRFDKADFSLRKVKEMGFKEAFLVSFYNNKKIPVDRAKEIEKSE